MKNASPINRTAQLLAAFLVASAIAACGGNNPVTSGGGGGGGGGASPTPAATAALSGVMRIATSGAGYSTVGYTTTGSGDQVVFSCGCTAQAGTTNTDSSGSFTLVQDSTATPSAPNPMYTIAPGRNYIIIAQGAGAQAWTIQFAGKKPSRNLYLTGSNASDIYTAAVSLYVFQNSTSSATAFDDWNFFNLQHWYTTLTSAPNAQEQTLLNDIVTQSVAAQPLYPSHPGWNASQPTNPKIAADLAAVKTSGDPTIPTPCPTNNAGNALCTGTPTP